MSKDGKDAMMSHDEMMSKDGKSADVHDDDVQGQQGGMKCPMMADNKDGKMSCCGKEADAAKTASANGERQGAVAAEKCVNVRQQVCK